MATKLIRIIKNNTIAVKVYYDSTLSEFIVKPSKNENQWYYTDNEKDAIETCKQYFEIS